MSFTSKNLSTSFDSRDSYIRYVSLWKSTYAELSQEIRTTKLTRRDANRAFSSICLATISCTLHLLSLKPALKA